MMRQQQPDEVGTDELLLQEYEHPLSNKAEGTINAYVRTIRRIKSEEMFGRGKSEEKIGRFGQTFLPFADMASEKKRPVAVLGETRPVYPD